MFQTFSINHRSRSPLRFFVRTINDEAFTPAEDICNFLKIEMDQVGATIAVPQLSNWMEKQQIPLVTTFVPLDQCLDILKQHNEEVWQIACDMFASSSSSSDESSNDDGSSSDSSSDSSEDTSLPPDSPQWVLSMPCVPSQFSRTDYTKSYALKSYDMPRGLKKELKKIDKWWSKERNRERVGQSLGAVTLEKRKERILCYLGFVRAYKCLDPTYELTVHLYLNHHLFQAYLQYLKDVRKCSNGTIGEAITAAISTCIWLYRKERRDGDIIRRYKDYRNAYQAKAVRERKQEDVEELKEKNMWLDWSEFTDLVQKLRNQWQHEEKPSVRGAYQLHDLLLLGLYSCVPSRGQEVRLLQYVPHDELELGELSLKKYVEQHQMNLLTCTGAGIWKMVVSQFKNAKFIGVDCTELVPFPWWTDLFQQYVEHYRPLLVSHKSNKFIFVTRSGEPFSGNYFSDFLSKLIQRETGKRLATNILRSSFVTHFYGSDASKDPVLRESIASVMRHSVDQALKTYDKRTTTQKKRKGLELLSELQDRKRVVEFKRQPHQVIERKEDQLLLARMERSSTSNAPLYFLPPTATYEWKQASLCIDMEGEWQEEEFLLK